MPQPVASSPRISSERRAAAASPGVSRTLTWLDGCKAYRCETWRWSISGAAMSQSSCHSCNCPARPIRCGGSRSRSAASRAASVASTPSSPAISMHWPNRSRSSARPSTAGAEAAPCGCTFSAKSKARYHRAGVGSTSTAAKIPPPLEQRVTLRKYRDRGRSPSDPQCCSSQAPPAATAPLRVIGRSPPQVGGCGADQPGASYMVRAVARTVSARSTPFAPAARRIRQRVGFARPVVHLGVDVDRVLAFPRRVQQVVPDALQVRWLRARPRTGDQQVAAELVVQRGQCGSLPSAKRARAHRWARRPRARRPSRGHAAEQSAMRGDGRNIASTTAAAASSCAR